MVYIFLMCGFQGLIIFDLSRKNKARGETIKWQFGKSAKVFYLPKQASWLYLTIVQLSQLSDFPGFNLTCLGAHLQIRSLLWDFSLKCNRKWSGRFSRCFWKLCSENVALCCTVALHRWLLHLHAFLRCVCAAWESAQVWPNLHLKTTSGQLLLKWRSGKSIGEGEN